VRHPDSVIATSIRPAIRIFHRAGDMACAVFGIAAGRLIQHDGNRMRVRPTYVKAIVLLALTLAGCSASQPSSTPADGLAGGPGPLCPEIQLADPNGDGVQLTGQWLATDFGTYSMTQRESCLHWLGLSPAIGEDPAGTWWTNVFVGRIESDFTINGEFADVPYPYYYDEGVNPNSGELTLDLTFFDDDSGAVWPTLQLVELQYSPGYGGEYWVPEDALPPRAELRGTYGFTDCPWLEVDGVRYELAEWQYETADQGQLLEGGQVVARPGDELLVEGQVWPAPTPTTCVSDLLLAWHIEVAP
jgi:hypothetical protein